MPISLRGTASNNASAGADVTVTLPGGIAKGDVVFAAYCEGGVLRPNQDMDMVTAGYTELADLFADDTLEANLGVFRKVQGVTPDTTAVFDGHGGSADGVAAAVVVLSDVDTVTPEDTATTTATGINDGTPDPPSITTVTAGAWVIAIGGSSAEDVPTAPANYENLVTDLNAADAGKSSVMMATRLIASPTSENPGVFGNIVVDITDAWAAATIAVRPRFYPAIDSDLGYLRHPKHKIRAGVARQVEYGLRA